MDYGMMEGWSGMGFGMGFGALMMIFWVVLFVGLIVLVVRWLGGTSRRNLDQDAQNALRQRFARGEIDVDEFETRSRSLREST